MFGRFQFFPATCWGNLLPLTKTKILQDLLKQRNLVGGFNPLKNIRQIGSFPQVGFFFLNVWPWNHHLEHNMDVSENCDTPKSSILIGFSIINHPFWGTLIFGNTHILTFKKTPKNHLHPSVVVESAPPSLCDAAAPRSTPELPPVALVFQRPERLGSSKVMSCFSRFKI